MFFILISLVSAIEYSKIPATGSPPSKTTASSAVYDPLYDRIITFGGFNYQLNSISSDLKTFDLQKQVWGEITPHSKLFPPGLESTYLYLRKDRKLFVFFGSGTEGISNEVFCFNLNSSIWTVQETTGDTIEGRDHYAFTSFEYEGNYYVAIFGGLTSLGLEKDLYLINTETFEVKKMHNGGQYPGIRTGITISYRKGCIYMYGYSKEGIAHDPMLPGIYEYSLQTNSWSYLTYDYQPSLRLLHYSYVYNDEMYILFGARLDSIIMFREIWKYNFDFKNWTLVKDSIQEFRAEAAVVNVGSKVYFVYGRDISGIYNTFIEIDLGTNPINITTISNSFNSPLKRTHHCSFVISHNIYIFGGQYKYGVYLNDMWKYDILLNLWQAISPLGEIPSPRSLFACTKSAGNSLAIYGGTNGDDIFDDLYFFQEAFMTWIKAPVKGNTPSPRYSSCISYYNYKYYIFGGHDAEKEFNEMWVYDYVNEKYTLLISQVLKYGLIRCACWIESGENSIGFNIIGGSTFWHSPNENWIKLDLGYDGKVTTSLELMNIKFIALSETNIIKTDKHIYVVFGSTWNKVVVDNTTIVDLSTKSISVRQTLNDEIEIYGHSVSHYGNALYVFGGGISKSTVKLPNTATNKFLKITKLQDTEESYIDCSPGTTPPDCTPCPAGTYFDNNQCVFCPKGKYSETLAATSIEQCLPCASGYYTDKLGSILCIQCPSGNKCSIGSSGIDNYMNDLYPSNIQPKSYKGPTNVISGVVVSMWYSILCLSGFIVFSTITIYHFWMKMNKFDIFTANHSHDLGVPIIHKKTNVGGLFSLFFIFSAIVTVIAAIVTYSLDNVTEIKALVPSIALDYIISAKNVEMNTTFYIYGGECVYNSSCIPEIGYYIEGLEYKSIKQKCYLENNNCIVSLMFDELSLVSTTSSILIEMREVASYASYIGVNISSTSSIPSEISSAFIPVDPKSSEHIFRGTTPSIISYKFTPSVFTSESGNWPSLETGFHISSYNDVTIGSLATQKTVNTQVYLRAQISIIKSDTGMQTQRILNSSLFVFVGSLLGSIFGLMGSFAGFMSFTENFVDSYHNKKVKKRTIDMMCDNLDKLHDQFGSWRIKKKEFKIHPIVDITTTS